MRPNPPSAQPEAVPFTTIYKGLLVAFVILCLLSGFLWNRIITSGLVIDTDLRALLPDTDDNVLSRLAETRLLNQLGNMVIVLVGAKTPETAVQAANFASDWLQSKTALQADLNPPLSQDPQQLILQLKDHRFHLLTPEQRQLLKNDNVQLLIDKSWASILGPSSWARITSVQEDPFALFDNFVEWLGQTSGTAGITRYGEYSLFSTAQRPGWFFAPLYINTGAKAFELEAQARTITDLTRLQDELQQRFSGIQTLKSGIIFHAAEAAQRARGEVMFIGAGSLLGIIVLFLAAFRSVTPLVMSLASVLFGCIIAFSIVHYFYSGLHIITLVFGAALIGVSVDYSLHYFTRKFSSDTVNGRFAILKSIFPAISLGLVTSVIGYGSLGQAPLPGLNQIAVFSVTGLIGAWLFVVVIYPWLGIGAPKPIPAYLIRWAVLPQRVWQGLQQRRLSPAFFLLGLTVLGVIGSALSFTSSDDIRVLHRPSVALLEQDNALKTIINSYAGNQFFIVTGATEQQLLQNEELLRPHLDALLNTKAITGYQAISRFLPSISRQQENYSLQKRKLYSDGDGSNSGPASRFMAKLGFQANSIEQLLQQFTRQTNDYLSPENWPGLQASGLKLLWLGRIENNFASLILLRGINDTDALVTTATRFDNVVFINKITELSNILQQQRYMASIMLVLAYVAVIFLLLLRYRRINAIMLPLVPLVSTLFTIILLSSFGMSIGLFQLFAMFLILGLGMDYSIFIYESPATETASHTAILFSAVTSCLSFGLLALSSTPMVQFFGATVLIGSILNLLLAPAVACLSPHNKSLPTL
ncbi:MAG: MMPL family transporter [Gammaproteobacteria bacterium]